LFENERKAERKLMGMKGNCWSETERTGQATEAFNFFLNFLFFPKIFSDIP
jgi:hypothetical protein